MNRRRALALTLAVAAVGAMTVGSMGFSSVSANRDVTVSVVNNRNAYLGVGACERSTSNATAPLARVTVSDRYNGPITVAAIGDENGTHPITTDARHIRVGGSSSFDATARAGDTVTVHVTGDGIKAVIDVTVEESGKCAQ